MVFIVCKTFAPNVVNAQGSRVVLEDWIRSFNTCS
jgi:hypothetical protein